MACSELGASRQQAAQFNIGEIAVRGTDGTMHSRARVIGSPEGAMREQSDRETWNSTRSLRYGEFMASMFLRYVIFADSENTVSGTADADGLDAHENLVGAGTFELDLGDLEGLARCPQDSGGGRVRVTLSSRNAEGAPTPSPEPDEVKGIKPSLQLKSGGGQ